MSYESLCDELYQQRLAEKRERERKRAAFRQRVLDRQNGLSVIVGAESFVMPDVLPENVEALKELVRLNLQMAHNQPEREKESKQNIKRIKKLLDVLKSDC